MAPPLTSQLPVVAGCHGEQSLMIAVDGNNHMTCDGNGKDKMSENVTTPATSRFSLRDRVTPDLEHSQPATREGHTEMMAMDDF